MLSKAAQKLLIYLGFYQVTPSLFADIISGSYPYDHWYNNNWFLGVFGKEVDYMPYYPEPARGLFKGALAELLEIDDITPS